MRHLTLIYWKNSALQFLKYFEDIGWQVKLVNYLDFKSEDYDETELFFVVLPDRVLDEIYDFLIKLKFDYRKCVLCLDSAYSLYRKTTLLNYGVDWYFAKPLSKVDLVKYASFFMYKYEREENVLRYKDIVLDLNQRSFTRKHKTYYLRNKEFQLLKLLLENHGMVLTKNKILENVWDMNFDLSTTTLESHICSLRKKLDSDFENKRLHTIHCVGYMLE